MKTFTLFFAVIIAFFFIACEDTFQLMPNNVVGNPNLAVTGFSPPSGVLREDTLTIYGKSFNPLSYQNRVYFPLESVEEQWVNGQGEITDSVVIRVIKYSENAAVVVDAASDSLKVIIPTNAVKGTIQVLFGLDTATSPVPYNLLTTELRPKILSFVPQFGGPGVTLNINVINGFIEKERMVVAFGSYKAAPDEIFGSGLISMLINVPNIFAGPVDLRVGKKLESGDTLWSASVNFGILPVPQNVPLMTVISYNGDETASGLQGIVGYASIVDGIRKQIPLAVTDPDLEISRGITFNAASDEVYWLDAVGTGALVLGNTETKKGDSKKITFGQIYNDLVFSPRDGKKYFYVSGSQIRRIEVNDQFKIPQTPGSSKKLYPTGTPSFETTNITCLKIVGNVLYWADEKAKKVFTATLTPAGDAFTAEPTVLYDFSASALTPFALAVNDATDEMFITVFDGEVGSLKSRLVRGSSDGAEISALVIVEEYDNTGDVFYDVELDLEKQFVYWTNGVDDGGIFRKSLLSLQAKPELVYQFPKARYFDIKTE